MKNFIFLVMLCACINFAFSQDVKKDCCLPAPYIEVTGSAEMEIVPDEIYVTIVLAERFDGKTKITIQKMETDMFAALKSLGIDAGDISLSDAESNFYYRKLKDDDALLSRNYTVMLANAEMVIKVYNEMGKLDAQDVFIKKVSHSKIEEYRMQTKIKATVAAKDKAVNMLTAIGETVGAPIYLQEINNEYYPEQQRNYSQYSNSLAIQYDSVDYQSNVAFQKIKIRYEVFGRFEIK